MADDIYEFDGYGRPPRRRDQYKNALTGPDQPPNLGYGYAPQHQGAIDAHELYGKQMSGRDMQALPAAENARDNYARAMEGDRMSRQQLEAYYGKPAAGHVWDTNDLGDPSQRRATEEYATHNRRLPLYGQSEDEANPEQYWDETERAARRRGY